MARPRVARVRTAPPASPDPHTATPVALILTGVALAVKLLALWQLHAHPLLQPRAELDNGVYLDFARRIAAGDLSGGDRVYFLSPLYMYFQAAILAITGGSVLAIQIAQVILGALAVGLIAAASARWYGRAGAWIAGALAILTGYFTFNEILLLQSSLDVFLTALGVWLLVRATRPRDFLLLGIVLGLHVLNRPNIGLWVVVLVLLIAIGSRRWKLALTAIAGVAIAIAPVAIRNVVVSGQPVLVSSHGGLNFYMGNNANANGTYRILPGITPSVTGQDRDMRDVVAAAVGHPVTDAEASRWFYSQAWSWIRSHPGDALVLSLEKLAYVVNAQDVALNDSYDYFVRDESTILAALAVGPWLILPIGILGFAITWPRKNGRAMLAAFVAVYAVSVALFFIAGRYRLPMLAALCVGASFALIEAWRRVRTRSWRWLAAAAAGAAALFVGTNLNLGLDGGRSASKAEMILESIRQGRPDEAEVAFNALAPDFPNQAMLHYRTAQTYLTKGDTTHALAHLDRAAAAAPDRPEIQLELGHALVVAGRPRAAVTPLRTALDARYKPELAAGDLARALHSGSPREALDVLHAIKDASALPPSALSILGRIALEAGDVELASDWLTRAAAGSSDVATAEALADALAKAGELTEAVSVLENAARRHPSDVGVHIDLAVTYARAGKFTDARRESDEALRLKPDDERAKRLKASLMNAR